MQPPALFLKDGTWRLNPRCDNLANLPAGYYERTIGVTPEARLRRMFAQEWVYQGDDMAVHPGFREGWHVAKQTLAPIRGQDLLLGVDFGLTPAAVIGQRDYKGQLRILREVVTPKDRKSNALQLGEELLRILNTDFVGYHHEGTADPAGVSGNEATGDSPIAILRSLGLEIYPAESNNPELRIAARPPSTCAWVPAKATRLSTSRIRPTTARCRPTSNPVSTTTSSHDDRQENRNRSRARAARARRHIAR